MTDTAAAEPRIAMVTGAGSGVGRAVALALMGAGYHVVLVGRRVTALAETVALAGDSPQATAIAADITDPVAVAAMFERIRTELGRLDLLFNNAGTGAPATPPDELSVDIWQSVVNVNLNGAFYCLKGAFGLMKTQKPRGGRIINNGSISAHVPRPGSIAYTATKHAITGLTRSAALDGRTFDIVCGQIDIGNAETDMTARMKQGVLQPDGHLAVEPTMDPKHVADAVLYMAALPLSVNAPFLTVMAAGMPFMGRG